MITIVNIRKIRGEKMMANAAKSRAISVRSPEHRDHKLDGVADGHIDQ
jgi:hypothetical protein